MKLLRTVLLFLVVISQFGFDAHCQKKTIRGKVVDAETKEPLPGVHILGFGKSTYGNTTNDEGDFILQVSKVTDSIRFSFIGFKSQTLLSSNLTVHDVTIRLQPYATPLREITVKAVPASQIVKAAAEAIPQNYEQQPFQIRGFYREQIKNDTTYYAIAEAIFESQFFPKVKGEEAVLLRLVQGRRSETVKSSRIFEDYHPSGGPNYLTENQLEVKLPPFMVEANFADYEYAVDSITSYDGRDVYVITFDQKATLKENLWKGKIFIEADSKAILEIVSALSPRGEEYRKHLSGKDKVVAGLLGIDFKLLNKKTRYSYHKTGDKWSLHDATLQLDIDFKQPRKQIDERINLTAELLSISQDAKNTTPITRGEQWQKNQLVLNLPGEFDEGFWGADNFIKPETSLTSAVASMKTTNEKTLSTGLTAEWQFFQQNLAKAYSKDSTVILKPYVESRWKDNLRAPLLWKWQEGDFDFSAKVKVAKATDEGSPPDKGFQVGGLMLRNANSELENYILLGLGCMGNEKMKIISQTNIRGNSAIHVKKVEVDNFNLRVTRVGSKISLFFFDVAAKQWELLRSYVRADMPSRIQLGLAGFSYFPGDAPNRKPDLLIYFDTPKIVALVK